MKSTKNNVFDAIVTRSSYLPLYHSHYLGITWKCYYLAQYAAYLQASRLKILVSVVVRLACNQNQAALHSVIELICSIN